MARSTSCAPTCIVPASTRYNVSFLDKTHRLGSPPLDADSSWNSAALPAARPRQPGAAVLRNDLSMPKVPKEDLTIETVCGSPPQVIRNSPLSGGLGFWRLVLGELGELGGTFLDRTLVSCASWYTSILVYDSFISTGRPAGPGLDPAFSRWQRPAVLNMLNPTPVATVVKSHIGGLGVFSFEITWRPIQWM